MNTEINLKDFLSPTILIMVVSTVLSVAISGWLLWPRVLTTLEAVDQKSALQQELVDLTTKLTTLQSYSDADYDQKTQMLKKGLPEDFDMPIILGSILKLAEDYSLIINKLDTRSSLKPTNAGLTNQSVSIELGGSPQGLDDFLKRLEQLAPVMRIMSMDYKGKSNDLSVRVSLVIETYALLDSKDALTTDSNFTIPELSASDQELLARIEGLEQFSRDEILELIGDENRNPFAFR